MGCASGPRWRAQPVLRSVETFTGHHAPELGPFHALTILLAKTAYRSL